MPPLKTGSNIIAMSRYLDGRKYALLLVANQLLAAVIVSTIGLVFSYQVALSLFLGGMICVLANFWLALVVFRPGLGAPLGKMLGAFYLGEIGKFIITALLFLLAFKKLALLKDAVHALSILSGYVLTQSVVWIYPLLKK
jgi:ATP synthase protein I